MKVKFYNKLTYIFRFINGGVNRNRTGDLTNAIRTLYQLSYNPKHIDYYNKNKNN